MPRNDAVIAIPPLAEYICGSSRVGYILAFLGFTIVLSFRYSARTNYQCIIIIQSPKPCAILCEERVIEQAACG